LSLAGRPVALPSAALALLVPAAAAAQNLPSAETAADRPDWLVMAGIGPRVSPSYPGSTHAELGQTLVLKLWRENEPLPVGTPDGGKSIRLTGERYKRAAGLSLALAPRRGREAATEGLPTVGFGVEAGVFAQDYVTPSLRVRGDVRRGIGAHAALRANVAVDYVLRSSTNDRKLMTLGTRARFASGKYNRRYFGIDASDAAATGLPQFRPEGGLSALGLAAGAHHPLDRRWGLYGFASYERLMGAGAASPLTRERGSRNQLSAGLALTYVLRVER
jgi:MipA family protein